MYRFKTQSSGHPECGRKRQRNGQCQQHELAKHGKGLHAAVKPGQYEVHGAHSLSMACAQCHAFGVTSVESGESASKPVFRMGIFGLPV
jgi:hypothetical protein